MFVSKISLTFVTEQVFESNCFVTSVFYLKVFIGEGLIARFCLQVFHDKR